MANKRANGEGTVRQLPSGKWQAQYMDGWKPDGRKNVKTWTTGRYSRTGRRRLNEAMTQEDSQSALMDKCVQDVRLTCSEVRTLLG